MTTIYNIELGSFINFDFNNESQLKDSIFYVDYIDIENIRLIDVNNLNSHFFKIIDKKIQIDGLKNINILNNPDEKGYARQNKLLPGKWINIHFGGDLPTIFIGEITNLEDDMIEIKLISGEVIYIDFQYSGIPLNIPISNIELRDKPSEIEETETKKEDESINLSQTFDEDEEVIETSKDKNIEKIKSEIKDIIINVEDFQIGEDIGNIKIDIEVPEKEKRYSLETQINDLLDEMLSTIPNKNRTDRVLNNLHLIIERFKQIRNEFSNFNEYGVIKNIKNYAIEPSLLLNSLIKLNRKISWLIPIVENKNKLYDIDNEIDYEDNDEFNNINLNDNINEMNNLITQYKNNTLPKDVNKYNYLINKLNPYFTPFDNILEDIDKKKMLYNDCVNANLEAIVNNFDDLYSKVYNNDEIKLKRFLIQKYNLGLTKLEILEKKSMSMTTKLDNLTKNDSINVSSFISMPNFIYEQSKIYLPNTTLLNKVNLNNNFIGYWQFLRNKISLNRKNKINNLNKVTLYEFNPDIDLSNDVNVINYFNNLIGNNNELFDLIHKFLDNKFNLHDIINFIEPFLIYHNELNSSNYIKLTNIILNNIQNYKSLLINKGNLLREQVKTFNNNKINNYNIFDLLNSNNDFKKYIVTKYNIFNDNNEEQYESDKSMSEILKYVLIIDCGKTLFNALNEINMNLYSSINLNNVLNNEIKINNDKKVNIDDKCTKFEIAKKYIDVNELNDDNNIKIYYDKNYDNTPYIILDEYKKERELMDDINFKDFLINELKNNIGLDDKKAISEAETLLSGKKPIEDNNYAILITDDKDGNEKYEYYRRINNVWKLEENIGNFNISNNSLCLIQDKCISSNNKCENIELRNIDINNENLTNIIESIDLQNNISKDEYEKNIIEKVNKYVSRLDKIYNINKFNYYKYNNEKNRLGTELEEYDDLQVVSPYSKLMNLILSEKDFVKKQNYIVRFGNEFTRPGNEYYDETIHWRYCKTTNTKLLPNFLFFLANSFISNNDNYENDVNMICANIGKLSDDGDAWVDKYSGYIIKKINFNEDEGYDEKGFKNISREIIESDINIKINESEKDILKEYTNPISIKVITILNALQHFMGLDIIKSYDFIIKNTLSLIDKLIPNQEVYERKSINKKEKTGKGLPPYKEIFNSGLIIITIGFLLISIQTSIPSIKTKKSFPGCKKSFSGYPLEGDGNYDALEYICCVAYKIKNNNIEPWNSIMKLPLKNLIIKVKETLTKNILTIPSIKNKINEKIDYLQIEENDIIPEKLDIKNWEGFMPPLFNIEIKKIQNVTVNFLDTLNKDILNKSSNQFKKIDVLQSKIMLYSLLIIDSIQKVIDKSIPLLTNLNNEPFLENACCNIDEVTDVLSYFEKEQPEIKQYKTIIDEINNTLKNIKIMSKSVFYLDQNNTKLIYPELSNIYSKNTIYKAFIIYCKYNSKIPINPNYLSVCFDKPTNINESDTVDEIMQKLLDENIIYNNDNLIELMKLVFKENIINIDYYRNNICNIELLRKNINNIILKKQSLFTREYIDNINNILDTFDYSINVEDENSIKFKNYLFKENNLYKSEIEVFIETNSMLSKNKYNKLKKNLKTIIDFKDYGDTILINNNDNNYIFKHQFITNNIKMILKTIPNIILNKVSYDSVTIPKFWKLSNNHNALIKEYLQTNYKDTQKYFNNEHLDYLFKYVINNSNDILNFIDIIPFQANIKNNKKNIPLFNYDLSNLILENLFWKSFKLYINITDDIEFIKNLNLTLKEKEQTTDDLESFESLEKKNNNDISILDIVNGIQKTLNNNLTLYFLDIISFINKNKNLIDYNYNDIKLNVLIEKEKEKDSITNRLAEKNDEERDVDNYLKKFKLGEWGVGLQKGFKNYDANMWDLEWEIKEKDDIIINKLNNDNVNDILFDIEKMELQEEQLNSQLIEKEEYDMSMLPNDDDYGDNDGDEYY